MHLYFKGKKEKKRNTCQFLKKIHGKIQICENYIKFNIFKFFILETKIKATTTKELEKRYRKFLLSLNFFFVFII